MFDIINEAPNENDDGLNRDDQNLGDIANF